jgi:hypothetical protein
MNEAIKWRRSSFCADGACAEVNVDRDVVQLRNSTRPEVTIELTAAEWNALKMAILNGEF